MVKTCPHHGTYRSVVWRGQVPFSDWTAGVPPMNEAEGLHCPENCGLCPEHIQGSCCVVLEVTKRCNLHCRFCFADAGEDTEPSYDSLLEAVRQIADRGSRPMLQLSGGEPTLRRDLPELVRAAKDSGIPYVQVNTNGIRLAEDTGLAQRLAEAGLDFVFLQFDGMDDRVYRTLRAKDLLKIKKQAVANCGAAGLAVTLVPAVAPDINLSSLGDIVKFAADCSPVVRGVHFQPVSYFGRIPGGIPADEGRCTLDELLTALCDQTGLKVSDFAPSRCDHPLCGFHGSFIAEQGRLIPLTHGSTVPRRMITAEENRDFTARRWLRSRKNGPVSGNADADILQEKTVLPVSGQKHKLRLDMKDSSVADMDVFLQKVRSQSFTLSSMPFQDAMNLDAERLRRCSLHVFRGGDLIPLCAEYLTPAGQGRSQEE
ncbi:MAG: radical SAM protein [Solobacterium sp.]|nr:radical SAM protein [Solobacterium sp.]